MVYIYDGSKFFKVKRKRAFSGFEDFLFSINKDAQFDETVWVIIEPQIPKDFEIAEIFIAMKEYYPTISICLNVDEDYAYYKKNEFLSLVPQTATKCEKTFIYHTHYERLRVRNLFIKGIY